MIVKLAIVLMFHRRRGHYALQASRPGAHANWHPFIPPNDTGAFGTIGWSGIARGAGVIFFAYIGFDAVSTAAQEAQEPAEGHAHRHSGSLVICTVLYIVVSGLLTGIGPYSRLNVADPVAVGIDATGVRVGEATWSSWAQLPGLARSCW